MIPKLSVLMSVAEDAPYVGAAIRSILEQTFADFEFIIVLDAPTDGSDKLVKEFQDPRIKVIANPARLGLTKSLNLGLKQCRAEWVARQDADDVSYPDRFHKQLAYVEKHSELRLLGTFARMMDSEGHLGEVLERPTTYESIRYRLFFDNAFIHSSVSFHRETVMGLGGYDEHFTRTQDFDLWSRIAFSHPVANLATPLLYSRVHSRSITARLPTQSDAYSLEIISASLKRFGFPVEWAAPLCLFRKSVFEVADVNLARELPAVLHSLRERFGKAVPEARTSEAIRAFEIQILSYLALCVSGKNRALSLCYLREIINLSPKSLKEVRWRSFLPRFALGETLYSKIRDQR